ERALTPLPLGALGQARRKGKCLDDSILDRATALRESLACNAELFTQRFRNLPEMRDLFHRRTDERGQAFPFRLTNDPQPATKISRRDHDRIVRERRTDFRERMIEPEVMRDHCRERLSPRRLGRHLATTNFQYVTTLLYVNR